jgi:hypothetical protein
MDYSSKFKGFLPDLGACFTGGLAGFGTLVGFKS